MSFVRTVLGDIQPEQLGVCYAHEHIIIERGFVTDLHPDMRLDSVDLASQELIEFHAAGGRAMVDSMPCGAGRNVRKLSAVSQHSGVHILCPTGLHLAQYYPPEHWGGRLGLDDLVERFVADIREGIDANDYSQPKIVRTLHRAGLIKVAGGLDRLDDHQRRIFTAAAETARRTGAPILTHTEQGTAALEQVQILCEAGAKPEQIVLSHTDRRPDVAYHERILSTGVFVEFDSAFRWPRDAPNKTLELIVAMFSRGFGAQIMLGMDAARRKYWRSYGGSPGLTFLLKDFSQQLLGAGLGEKDLEQIFRVNPARAYAFKASA